MAPVRDDMQSIQETIKNLELRVRELEESLKSSEGRQKDLGDKSNIRLILMGPPGAGMKLNFSEMSSSCWLSSLL